ncbi:hypothetical protein FRB96_004677 [Tulasnella sp. 330]|nr:hypothetical protein FRB96_004677 [Tulasnella sp. 330]KAG8878797.1 hypothetical protein FRB97_002214 [Tulasnella sp. 331]
MLFQLRADDEAVKEQMELGNLTKNDMNRMNDTVTPNIYPMAGGLILGQIAFGLTKFKPGTRTIAKMFTRASLVGTSGIVGIYAGHQLAGKMMKRNYSSLENPEGYKAAIKAIKDAQLAKQGQEVIAISWTYGIVIGQPIGQAVKESQGIEGGGQASRPGGYDQGVRTDDFTTSDPLPSSSPDILELPRRPLDRQSTQQTSNPSSASNPNPTSWDVIRGRNQSAQPTAWDIIRQRQERERIPSTSSSTSNPSSSTSEDAYRPEAAPVSSDDAESAFSDQVDAELSEQEKFDALLEAERRMGGRSPDAYAGWGGDDKYSRN